MISSRQSRYAWSTFGFSPSRLEPWATPHTKGYTRLPPSERTCTSICRYFPSRRVAAQPTKSGGASNSVQLRAVTKKFDEFVAVDDLTLEIAGGSFFTLLGPSGCGKTTTLRMIAGFEQPTEGEVLIEGSNVAGLPPHQRPTNTVFQSYALFPHLTVLENVEFGLRRSGVKKDESRSRATEELERVGLASEAAKKPAQLSGGQQQRVALARALVNRPKVLLLDEPLGALDLKLRKGLQIELKRIQQEVGITFVYVTHDQEEALTMSDQIAVMNKGRVEQVADPGTVYDRPTTSFVAGFIGVSNLMPAKVVKGGKSGEVELEAGPAVKGSADGLKKGDRCHAIVRPEKLVIEKRSSRGGKNRPSVDGVVESSLYLGTSTQILVRLQSEVPMTVLVPNVSERERDSLPGAGAEVKLAWDPENMHVVRDSTGA